MYRVCCCGSLDTHCAELLQRFLSGCQTGAVSCTLRVWVCPCSRFCVFFPLAETLLLSMPAYWMTSFWHFGKALPTPEELVLSVQRQCRDFKEPVRLCTLLITLSNSALTGVTEVTFVSIVVSISQPDIGVRTGQSWTSAPERWQSCQWTDSWRALCCSHGGGEMAAAAGQLDEAEADGDGPAL